MISILTTVVVSLSVVCLFLAWMLLEEKKENKLLTRYILELKNPAVLARIEAEKYKKPKQNPMRDKEAIEAGLYQDVMRKKTIGVEEKKVLEMEKLLK